MTLDTLFWPDRRGRIALVCFLFAAALLYLLTLDNGLAPGDLVGGDLITHQYAQVQARPSNAPGYPLYTMGGWLWFHGLRALAPAANPTPILAAYSTLWALIALALLFLLIYRLTRGNLVVTVGLSTFYAITYFFWFYSVTTEQYTSAVAQTIAIVALAHAWDEHPRDRYLYGIAFLLGLSLAHMVTTLFVAPGVILFILARQPRLLRRGRLIAGSILLALTPLLSYVFIYIRGAQHPEWRGQGQWPSALAWFLSFVSTQQGRDELTWQIGPFTAEFPRLVWVEVTPLLLLLGVIGWVLLGRRALLMYGITAIIYLVFGYIDRFGNWYQVVMPLYPLIIVGAGVVLGRAWAAMPGRAGRLALSIVLIGLIIFKFAETYPRADQRNRSEDTGLIPGQTILAANPPNAAAIVAASDEKLALDYLTQIWGLRPDLRAISTAEIADAIAASRPVLVTTDAAGYAASESGLPLRYTGWGPGLLWAGVGAIPQVEYGGAGVDQPLGDGLRLIGLETQGDSSEPWRIALTLAADAQPMHDWALSVRLLAGGSEVAQLDHAAPAEGYTPTRTLLPGDIVRDVFAFELPPGVQPDGVRVILYRAGDDGGFENLSVVEQPIAAP